MEAYTWPESESGRLQTDRQNGREGDKDGIEVELIIGKRGMMHALQLHSSLSPSNPSTHSINSPWYELRENFDNVDTRCDVMQCNAM